MDIGKRIVVHRLLEIDGVENLDVVVMLQQGISALNDDTALRKRFVNTENDNSLKNELFFWCTALEIACCHFLTD